MKRRKGLLTSSPPLFSGLPFLEKFSTRVVFLFLVIFLLGGLLIGAMIGAGLLESRTVFFLFFSGIPSSSAGFMSCFTTLLLNVLIGLIVLFLLGITAFGVFAVPLFLFLKGITIGIGALSFFFPDGLYGLGRSAFLYTPAATASAFLLLLFAVRALVFSNRLAKAGFSPCEENLDFNRYLKDFLVFLCLAVALSLVGSLPAVLYAVFFP